MSFHQRNNNYLSRDNVKKNIFFPVISIIFFIAVFSISWSRNLLFSVGSPLWSIKNSISSFFLENIGILNSKNFLLKENSSLKDQILAKNNEQILYDVLKKENEDLKNINSRNTTNHKLLLSAVLVKPFLSL